MRWTIALTAAGVLLAAGIAVSQQPPGDNTQAVGGAAPPSADVVGTQAPPGADARPAVPLPAPPRLPAPNAAPGSGGWSSLMQTPYVGRLFSAEADPETAELHRLDHQLEQESRTLVNELAQSPEDDANARDQLKQKLRDTLERQFEAQQRIRETEVTRIEARVKKLREMIDKRNGARRTIVDRRQQQLMDDAEGFGWSSAGATTPNAAVNYFATPPVTVFTTGPNVSNSSVAPSEPPPSAALPGASNVPGPGVRPLSPARSGR